MSLPLAESQVLLECLVNPNNNLNCPCLLSGGGPAMNTDVSGIGVRISFYLQALFLACLSICSKSVDEITGALYTLIITNIAMAVTSLILGFKSEPEISLHDALIVLYLLALSWTTLFFSLSSYNSYVHGDNILKYLSILQSYVLFTFTLAILIKAESFGSTPLCNSHAVAVIFRPINALHRGRIAALIFVSIIVVVYSCLTVIDYMPSYVRTKEEVGIGNQYRDNGIRMSESQHLSPSIRQWYDLGIPGKTIVEIIVVLILWALMVMNTELLILWNNFAGDGSGTSPWQFGQVLSMLLVVIPLANIINAFAKPRELPSHIIGMKLTETPLQTPPFQEHTHQIWNFDTMSPTTRPDGNMPAAHISEESVHTELENGKLGLVQRLKRIFSRAPTAS